MSIFKLVLGRFYPKSLQVGKCSLLPAPGLPGSDQVKRLFFWMKAEKRGLFSALEGHFQG